MSDTGTQLERLKSPNKDMRYEACEELRLTESLPAEAIRALEVAANDEDALVADAAQRALLAHRPPPLRSHEDVDLDTATTEQKNLAGLGGWLILVGVGVVLSPLAMFLQMIQGYPPLFSGGSWEALTTPGAESYHPLWGPVLITEVAANAGLLLARFLLVYLFFAKKRAFPKWFIGITLFNMIFVVADMLAFRAIWPDMEISGADALSSIIPSLIWVIYMMRSKRVKATFVK